MVKMMLSLGLVCAAFLGCMAAVVPESKESKLAHATNDLAFDLLRSYGDKKNVFLSPFSISTALALVYLGADGTTARAMRNVLKYDQHSLTPEEVNQGFQSLLSRVKDHTDQYKLTSYNNVLVQKSFPILESYKQALQQYFSARTENVDFASQGEEVREKVNAAVESVTNGKIKDFLNEPPSSDTKLFLLNAVYFLGNWKNPFDPEFTRESSFYNNGVQEKKVQTMSRNGVYQYSTANDLNAAVVVLPYKGANSANMIIVRPNSRTGIADLERTISQDALDKALRTTTRTRRIQLYVPKFNLSYEANLVEPLSRLGLGELFGDSANLSRIAGAENGLKVSSVLHKAVIDVNEKGSEAAAATGVEIVPTSLPPTIQINHPFLFFIQEATSGMILFSGRVDAL